MKCLAWIVFVLTVISFCASYYAQAVIVNAQAYQEAILQPLPPTPIFEASTPVANAS